MQNLQYRLLPSLLFAVACIPNHTLRYTSLGLITGLTVVCTAHLKSPSAQLRQLATMIDATDNLIDRAAAQCPRDHLRLTKHMGRLLECISSPPSVTILIDGDYRINKISSLIKCHILSSDRECFSWNKYRVLSGDIGECVKVVKDIRLAVQLTVEAELQRKLTDKISETSFILAASAQAVPQYGVYSV
ncbi:hypothetical protein MVEN_00603500 [Mycena venus]|uniref:Uncharacterized protein n=1 Tax=Mycena venus TaxID=2733690 RepID=A0A8H6YJV8_9AGAR|nr:hypothetical protein MVEN_00603500 [Mycena venus]